LKGSISPGYFKKYPPKKIDVYSALKSGAEIMYDTTKENVSDPLHILDVMKDNTNNSYQIIKAFQD